LTAESGKIFTGIERLLTKKTVITKHGDNSGENIKLTRELVSEVWLSDRGNTAMKETK
jgi:hypothetical protein